MTIPMEKDNFVVSTYPNVVLPAFLPSSRKSSREMPDTKKTDLISLPAVFLHYIVRAVVTLPWCNECAVLGAKGIHLCRMGLLVLFCHLHIREDWSGQVWCLLDTSVVRAVCLSNGGINGIITCWWNQQSLLQCKASITFWRINCRIWPLMKHACHFILKCQSHSECCIIFNYVFLAIV